MGEQALITTGARGLHIAGMQLVRPCKPVGVGMHVVKLPSLGSGRHVFDNPLIKRWDIAVVCGEDESDGNCDMLTFNQATWDTCSIGLQLRNWQSVGHVLRGGMVRKCGMLVDVIAGGRVTVADMNIVSCDRIFNIQRSSRQTGHYELRGGNMDAGSGKDSVEIAKVHPGITNPPTIIVNGFFYGAPVNRPVIIAESDCTVRWIGCDPLPIRAADGIQVRSITNA